MLKIKPHTNTYNSPHSKCNRHTTYTIYPVKVQKRYGPNKIRPRPRPRHKNLRPRPGKNRLRPVLRPRLVWSPPSLILAKQQFISKGRFMDFFSFLPLIKSYFFHVAMSQFALQVSREVLLNVLDAVS